METSPAPLVAEALRLHARYMDEFVESYDLCPWAAHARRAGRVLERVLLQEDDALEPTLELVESLAPRAELEIGLAIFPRLRKTRLEFDHFVARIREADDARHPRGEAPFATAAFHPEAAPDTANAERLIPFMRRTPFPTLQLVRYSVLERAHGRAPPGTQFLDLDALGSGAGLLEPPPMPVRDRVGRNNLDTARRVGVETLERVLGDITRDRDETLARLGER